MAEDKKSFVAYCDWKATFDILPDEIAGKLIKHLFAYVNDENPSTDDLLINAVFSNIKMQLKRDLKNWEKVIKTKVSAGRIGGVKSGEARRRKKQNEANEADALKSKQNEANEAVNVNVNVNDNDNVNKEVDTVVAKKPKEVFVADSESKIRIRDFDKRKEKFYGVLSQKTFIEKYTKTMLRDFFDYWTEPNKSRSQMKFEMQKTWDLAGRLRTWEKNDIIRNSFNAPKISKTDQNLAISLQLDEYYEREAAQKLKLIENE
jgi:hypothetical protein